MIKKTETKTTGKEKGFVQQPFTMGGVNYNVGEPIALSKEQFKNLSDKNVGMVGKEKPKGKTKEAKGGVVKG